VDYIPAAGVDEALEALLSIYGSYIEPNELVTTVPSDSGDVTARYAYVHWRMARFAAVEAPAVASAWATLNKWRSEIKKRYDRDLPAPAVFANEKALIEFEWHMSGRSLQITMLPEAHVAFYEEVDTREEEGVTSEAQIPERLARVMGYNDADPQ
jgi:hypothetical protein